MIKRSDGSIVPEEYIWRENQNIYILDNLDSEYQIIFSNATSKNDNTQDSTEDNSFIWGMVFTLIIIISLILIFTITHKQRKILTFYVKKGNNKINEIDDFVNKFNSKKN